MEKEVITMTYKAKIHRAMFKLLGYTHYCNKNILEVGRLIEKIAKAEGQRMAKEKK